MIALTPTGSGRLWLMLAGVLLAFGLIGTSLYLAYDHGRSVENAEWQSRWNARDAGDQQAWGLAQAGEREKEQARQHSINKAIQDGQQLIDQALADAAAARATAGSLRDTADDLARRLSSQTGGHSCTASASAAATRAVLVLADVLKRADERAGDLAEYADQGRGRGLTCEQAYGALN